MGNASNRQAFGPLSTLPFGLSGADAVFTICNQLSRSHRDTLNTNNISSCKLNQNRRDKRQFDSSLQPNIRYYIIDAKLINMHYT